MVLYSPEIDFIIYIVYTIIVLAVGIILRKQILTNLKSVSISFLFPLFVPFLINVLSTVFKSSNFDSTQEWVLWIYLILLIAQIYFHIISVYKFNEIRALVILFIPAQLAASFYYYFIGSMMITGIFL